MWMGRGLGNGGAAWEGPPEPRSPARPRPRPRPQPGHTPLSLPHPLTGAGTLPVHCRTGQSFAPKNRATQPASHTSGEKMAARARRKLPKVPERTGQRAAAERAERSGARRRREPSGGAQGPGWGSGRLRRWLPPPARAPAPALCDVPAAVAGWAAWVPCCGRCEWDSLQPAPPVCLRLARMAGLLPGSLHFSLQPQAGLLPPTQANPSPSLVTLHLLSPREKYLIAAS